MSSMKIKLLGLLILMGCVTVEASTFYTYKKPDGATIITTREVKEPGYELLNITIHQANGPILETRGLSNNSVSTSNVSKPTSTNSVSKSNVSKFSLYTTNFTEPLSYQDSAFLKLPKFP